MIWTTLSPPSARTKSFASRGYRRGGCAIGDRTKFFAPTYTDENPRSSFSRIYSFKDVVALRTLEMLRVQNGEPLQQLRRVAEKLAELGDELWTSTTLWVLNKTVVIQPSGDERPREVVSGQYVLGVRTKKGSYPTRKMMFAPCEHDLLSRWAMWPENARREPQCVGHIGNPNQGGVNPPIARRRLYDSTDNRRISGYYRSGHSRRHRA